MAALNLLSLAVTLEAKAPKLFSQHLFLFTQSLIPHQLPSGQNSETMTPA